MYRSIHAQLLEGSDQPRSADDRNDGKGDIWALPSRRYSALRPVSMPSFKPDGYDDLCAVVV